MEENTDIVKLINATKQLSSALEKTTCTINDLKESISLFNNLARSVNNGRYL